MRPSVPGRKNCGGGVRALAVAGAGPVASAGVCPRQVANEETSPVASYWAAAELRRLAAEEREWRCRLWSQGARPHQQPCPGPAASLGSRLTCCQPSLMPSCPRQPHLQAAGSCGPSLTCSHRQLSVLSADLHTGFQVSSSLCALACSRVRRSAAATACRPCGLRGSSLRVGCAAATRAHLGLSPCVLLGAPPGGVWATPCIDPLLSSRSLYLLPAAGSEP